MANTILTPQMITDRALAVLENTCTLAPLVNRQLESKFGVEGSKIGPNLQVRLPARYVGRSGAVLAVEDFTDSQTTMTVATQFGVDINFTSAELALSLDDFTDRVIKPAIATVANRIDFDLALLYQDVFASVGTPGSVPNAFSTYAQAGAKLLDQAAPDDGERSVVISPTMEFTIVDALKGLFQDDKQIGRQYVKGRMGSAIGFDWYRDQNVRTHTVGPQGGTPLVNGAGQTGSNLVTDGWTAAAAARLNKGDIIAAAGSFAVNPQNRQSLGYLQQFVVTANVSSDGAGNATIPIYPPIVTSGQLQTVTASPTDNGAITVTGTANTLSPQGLVFHPDAFALVMAELPLPRGVDFAYRSSSKKFKTSIRIVRQYDINNDKFPCRLDVLFGTKTIRPELACRVQS